MLLFVLTVGARLSAQTKTSSAGNFAKISAEADSARDANDLDRAASLYRKALALRPSWAEGWWSLGTILYDQDSYAPAAKAFGRLVTIDPKNGTAFLMLGLCEYQLNLNDKAMTHIQAAKQLGIKKDEQLEHVLRYHEGMLCLRRGAFEDALDPLGILLNQGVRSEDLDAAFGMAVLLILPNTMPTDARRVQVVLPAGRAEELAQMKKTEEARKAYDTLAQQYSDFPNIHYAYGRFLLSLEEVDEAVKQFEEEIKRDPSHVRARMEIAATHYRVDSAAGIPYVKEVIRLKPNYPFGHYLLGLLYFDSGNVAKSIPELETAVRMVPKEAQFQFALGNAYARAGRKEEAARARTEFRRLGGDVRSTGGPSIYGQQHTLSLDHSSGTPPSAGDPRPR